MHIALLTFATISNWEDWRHQLGYLDYLVLVGIVVEVIYLVVKRRRCGKALEAD